MTRKTLGRATAAGLSIATLAMVGLSATPAMAADPAGNANNASIQEINSSDLTIHKRAQATEGAEAPTGLVNDAAPGDPLNGAEFTVTPINGLDLKTNEGWQKAAALTDDANAKDTKADIEKVITTAGYTLGEGNAKKTAGDGVAKWENLEVGLYLVEETETPTGYIGSKPFVVALPLTNPQTKNTWNNDVHLYPKNVKTEAPKKALKDSETPGAGNETETDKSVVTWTVTSKLPNVSKLDRYQVIDPLDARLTYVPGGASDELKITGDAPETLTRGTDYFVDVQELSNKAEVAKKNNGEPGSWVTVKFTEEGLKKLAKAGQAGGSLEWTLKTNIDETTGGIKIDNTAYVDNNPNSGWDVPTPPEPGNPPEPHNPPEDTPPTTPPGTPTNTPKTFYGKVTLTKKAKDDDTKTPGVDESQGLKGAKFQVFECTDVNNLTGNAITVDGVSEWTSNDEGKVVIDGLLANDYRDDKVVERPNSYCLKETEAPAGYELLAQPISFQILSNNGTAQPGAETLTPTAEAINVPKNGGFNLPLTGGAGIAPLVTIGGLLILGSGAYVAASNRKKQQA